MLGSLIALSGLAGSRLAFIALALALWLIKRPGGWAVLALGALVAVKL